jgi:hypothetical protein
MPVPDGAQATTITRSLGTAATHTLGDTTSARAGATSRAHHGTVLDRRNLRNRGARRLTIGRVGEGSGGGERGAEHRHGEEEAARRRHFDSPRARRAPNPPRRFPAKSRAGSANPECEPEQEALERSGSFRGAARLRDATPLEIPPPNSAPTRGIALGSRDPIAN